MTVTMTVTTALVMRVSLPKNLLMVSLVLSASSFLYIWGKLRANEQEENRMALETRLAAVRQELQEAKKRASQQENLKRLFLKAQALGLLQKGDRQKLVAALEGLPLESGLERLSYEVSLTEKKTFANFPCRLTRVTLRMEHPQDRDIFRFVQDLPQKVPGALIPEQFSLTRHEASDGDASDSLGGISGTYHFYLLTLENSSK